MVRNMNFLGIIDEVCVGLGKLTCCLFDIVYTVFKCVIELVKDVYKWARELFLRCADKFMDGWRAYYLEVDVEKIPPTVIPRDRLKGAKKISIGIMTDKNMNPQRVDRVFVHDTVDEHLACELGDNRCVELVL